MAGADDQVTQREPITAALSDEELSAKVNSALKRLGILAILLLAAYLPALKGEFVSDDKDWVALNPMLSAEDGLRRIWFGRESDQYQPLVYTSFWLERRLWDVRPGGYHVVNLGLHFAGSVALWLLLARLGVAAPWVGAMLFALHPVNVESVAWIYERKNCLAGVFFFFALLVLLRFEERGGWGRYVLGLLLFCAALLSKASTVVLPAVLALVWWWRGGAWTARRFAALVPLFVLSAAMAGVTVWYEQNVTGAVGAEYAASFAERIARAGWIAGFSLGKLLVPYNLIFMYPRWSVDASSALSYLPTALWLAALVVFWTKRRTWGRAALLGVGYYLIAMSPMLGFFDIFYFRYTFVADHFQYLASPGVLALVVHAGAYALDRVQRRADSAGKRRFGKFELALVAVGICWALSFERARIYRTGETLWTDTIQRNPSSWVAHFELGDYFLNRPRATVDDLERAAQHLRSAVQLKPDFATALVNLGAVSNMLGRPDEALDWLRKAVQAEPNNPTAVLAYGTALLQRNDLQGAIPALHALVKLRPQDPKALYMLADALCRAGGLTQGRVFLAEAVRLSPGNQEMAATLARLDEELSRRSASQPAP